MTLIGCEDDLKTLSENCLLNFSWNKSFGLYVVSLSLFSTFENVGLVISSLDGSVVACTILTCNPSDGNSRGGVGLMSGIIVVQIVTPENCMLI